MGQRGESGFHYGIGCTDPRSQKRDLGHPSISPFDVAGSASFFISAPKPKASSVDAEKKRSGDRRVADL
jgi:hypothetical protein